MTNYTLVGTKAVNLPNPQKQYDGNLVILTGTGNLYYSNQAGVSPTTYDGVMTTTGVITRLPTAETWVCTDAGQTISANWSTDGTVLTPGEVTLSPGTAVNINGTVPISVAAPVNVIPQNTSTVLDAELGVASTYQFTSPGVLTGYGSIVIRVIGDSTVAPGAAVFQGTLTWLTPTGGTIADKDFVWDSSGSFILTTPVISYRFILTLNKYNVNPTHTLVRVDINGLTDTLSESYIHSYTQSLALPIIPAVSNLTLNTYAGNAYRHGTYIDTVQAAAGVNGTIYLESQAGPCEIALTCASNSTSAQSIIHTLAPTSSGESILRLGTFNTSVSGTIYQQPTFIPWAPLAVIVAGTVTTSRILLGITY